MYNFLQTKYFCMQLCKRFVFILKKGYAWLKQKVAEIPEPEVAPTTTEAMIMDYSRYGDWYK